MSCICGSPGGKHDPSCVFNFPPPTDTFIVRPGTKDKPATAEIRNITEICHRLRVPPPGAV